MRIDWASLVHGGIPMLIGLAIIPLLLRLVGHVRSEVSESVRTFDVDEIVPPHQGGDEPVGEDVGVPDDATVPRTGPFDADAYAAPEDPEAHPAPRDTPDPGDRRAP